MLAPYDTLPPFPRDQPTLGWGMLEWIYGGTTDVPRFQVVDGPNAGEPFRLTARQLRFWMWWWALSPRDGMWVHRGAVSRLSRGKYKSPMAALIGICDFLGPARPAFDAGKLQPRPGRPAWDVLGQPVSMPLVQFGAVAETQTENSWRYVEAWSGKGTPLALEYNLDVGKVSISSPTVGTIRGGKMTRVTSNASTVRGARPTLFVGDEQSEWHSSNGGLKFAKVVDDNVTKVPFSRMYGLANAWSPGTESYAEQLWDGWELEQEFGGRRPLLMDVIEAPADTDWSDEDSVEAAIGLIYAEEYWVDQTQVVGKVLDPAKDITESQREYGNLRVAGRDSWTDAQVVEQNKQENSVIIRGETIVLACDPSESDDCTGLVACRLSDGFVEPLWFHDPIASGRDTNFGELDEFVSTAFELYDVVGFMADVNPAEHYVKTVWPQRYGPEGENKLLVPAGSGDDWVAFDNRKHRLKMLQATEKALADLKAKELPHSGHKTLVRHILNCHRRESVGYVGVRKGTKSKKIDLAVTMIMARYMRDLVLASDAWQERNREHFSWVIGS